MDIQRKYSLSEEIANEVAKLIEEAKQLNFKTSSQLSDYIKRNRSMQNKYPNITGKLNMIDSQDEWILEGAIAPAYYRIVCTELGLTNQNSSARPNGFQRYGK